MDESKLTLTITLTTPTGLVSTLATGQVDVGAGNECQPAASAAALLELVPTHEALGAAIFEAFEDHGISCTPE